MFQYDRIEVSEVIDINKSNKSRVYDCHYCQYWHFKDIGYKFEPYVCNKCYNISMMVYELKNCDVQYKRCWL